MNVGPYRCVHKSVGNHVIGPRRPLSIAQLRSYSTKFIWQHYQIMDPLILTVFNLVSVNFVSLYLRYFNPVRYAAETCLRTDVPPLWHRRSTRVLVIGFVSYISPLKLLTQSVLIVTNRPRFGYYSLVRRGARYR